MIDSTPQVAYSCEMSKLLQKHGWPTFHTIGGETPDLMTIDPASGRYYRACHPCLDLFEIGARHEQHGLCAFHSRQAETGAPFTEPKPGRPPGGTSACLLTECDRDVYALGLCNPHYQKSRRPPTRADEVEALQTMNGKLVAALEEAAAEVARLQAIIDSEHRGVG